ncbi:MAG: MFS transporter [Gemmataceae bacterium]|nr:MFS transporter [Gemmataceae bacterium]MDW8263795.1 MFS transporter [Gemmataceae bacterium]
MDAPGETSAACWPRLRPGWPHYQLFLLGSFVSWVGDWMDLAALNWVVLERTGSAFNLGVVNACRLVPVFALSIPAGILADRYDRRRLLIVLQGGLMAATVVVAVLVSCQASFGLLLGAVLVRSVVAAMVPPVRNVLVPDLVPPQALAQAISGQMAVMNLSRIVGPAIAGFLLARVSAASVFWVNSGSFALVLVTSFMVRVVSRIPPRQEVGWRDHVVEAVGYLRRSRSVQALLALAVVPMVFGFPYTALMPLFARELWGLGPEGFGALLAASGVGALLGAAWLSVVRPPTHPGRWLVASVVAFGAALGAFALVRGVIWAVIAVFLVGFFSQAYRTMSRITLQAEVPPNLRGRIVGIALMDRGFIPLGALVLGGLADIVGACGVGVVMGAGCVAISLGVLGLQPQLWRLSGGEGSWGQPQS